MMFGPWMNNEDEIDYTSRGTFVSTGAAAQNNKWKLVSAGVFKKIITVNSKDGKYTTKFPNLLYYFLVERHSSLISTVVGGKHKKKSEENRSLNWNLISASCMIMVCINVLAIFIDVNLNERITLLTFNILLHFQLIHQISWMVPHNADSVPNTSKRIEIFWDSE